MLAAGAIRAGQYDCVLVFGIEKMPRGIIRSSFFEPWREEAGLAATPAYFAFRAQRLMRESGLTKEHLAQVVVKNRRHGVNNPDAMFRREVTAEQVLAIEARLRATPPLDALLTERRRGRGRAARGGGTGAGNPVTLEAAVLRSHLPGSVLGEATPLAGIDDADDHAAQRRSPPTRRTRKPASVPTTSTSSSARTPTRPASCSRGRSSGSADRASRPRSWPTAARRSAEPGRSTSRAGCCRRASPSERRALGQVVELVRQLRGEAGARQVEGARVGLAHTVGRGANASVTIVKR